MPESDNRMERLEREVRRLRTRTLVLAVALVATFALGATQCAPDELTLRKLTIVDEKGRKRIVAETTLPDTASLVHYDRDGNRRIDSTTTSANWSAGITHYDGDETMRITSATLGGQASIGHYDAEGRKRIDSSTTSGGMASFVLYDGERERISAMTLPLSTAELSLYDRNHEERIQAVTLSDGRASIWHSDADGKLRISIETLLDGSADVVITNGKGEPVWWKTSSK